MYANQLIGLERHRPVSGRARSVPRLVDRRIRQPQERRLVHRQRDVHVHRHVGGQPGRPDLRGQPHPPEDLHRPGVAPLHLRQELRRGLPVDQRAVDAAASEIDGQGEADRSRADHEHVRPHWQPVRHEAQRAYQNRAPSSRLKVRPLHIFGLTRCRAACIVPKVFRRHSP